MENKMHKCCHVHLLLSPLLLFLKINSVYAQMSANIKPFRDWTTPPPRKTYRAYCILFLLETSLPQNLSRVIILLCCAYREPLPPTPTQHLIKQNTKSKIPDPDSLIASNTSKSDPGKQFNNSQWSGAFTKCTNTKKSFLSSCHCDLVLGR